MSVIKQPNPTVEGEGGTRIQNIRELRLVSKTGPDTVVTEPANRVAELEADASRKKYFVEPIESPDGSRTSFTAPEDFVDETLVVTRNGMEHSDFTISGNQVTLNDTPGPLSWEIIRFHYEPTN